MPKKLLVKLIIGSVLILPATTGCTNDEIPVISTASVTNITEVSATCGGTVISDGGAEIISRGFCWSKNENPTIIDPKTVESGGTGQFVSNISGLSGGTLYHVRTYATNSTGTGYGSDVSFSTLGLAPSTGTLSATGVTSATAILNGTVNANYLSTTVTFEYGKSNSYGNIGAYSQSPVTGNSNTAVSVDISGLSGGTTYYFRVKAVNSLGTTYGNPVTFTTTEAVTDIDGNTYNTVKIGTQLWMAENLRATKYNDGTPIPNVQGNSEWGSLTTGGYSDYDNITSNSAIYGRLYNWYVVDNNAGTSNQSNGGKNVCPTGWHVPSNGEWTILENFLIANGYNFDGISTGNNIAKSLASKTLWLASNEVGTAGNPDYPSYRNKSGFTAVPAGGRVMGNGIFATVGLLTNWWSTTYDSASLPNNPTFYVFIRGLSNNFQGLGGSAGGTNKQYGNSVRCLKD